MPDNAPLLSVIIVNVDTAKWLKPCHESLQEHDISESIEVVVVDNGSADVVRQDFPDVKLVTLEETVGFGTANNFGATHPAAPVLLFLNPDTRTVERSLSQLLRRFEVSMWCTTQLEPLGLSPIAQGLIYVGPARILYFSYRPSGTV